MLPLVNIEAQYNKIKQEVMDAIENVLNSRSFIQGEYVAEFESKFTSMHDMTYGCACSSGTSALSLSLEALGVGVGDEVITAPNSFIATVEAIYHVGAKPVFVDILEDTYCMNPDLIEERITDKTKAIIPVHIYGNPCDMDKIMDIAQKHSLKVLEDCAQAHFATYKGKYVGTFGDVAAYSFYPGKNLGAYGDAGFVICKTKACAEHVRKLSDHGRLTKYKHDVVGYNHRMDGLQAAILLVKLKYLQKWTECRQRNASEYDRLLEDTGVRRIASTRESESVYHLYVVQVSNRQEVIDFLKNKGITASIHYPVPLHLQPALEGLGYRAGDFPVCERAADRVISLPMCGELSLDQVSFIVNEFAKVAVP